MADADDAAIPQPDQEPQPDPAQEPQPDQEPQSDPVLVKRARASELANLGKRLGYSVILIAIVVFGFGVVTGFEEWMVVVVTACLALSAVFLVPAVIVGYGVSAANREEREERAQRAG